MATTRQTPTPQVDVEITGHGSIFLFQPQSEAAREWVYEHVHDAQWFGDSLAVEFRYAADLADGMRRDGLTLA